MLGKFRLVKALGWDYSGKILAGRETCGVLSSRVQFQPSLQGQPVLHTLLLLPVAPILCESHLLAAKEVPGQLESPATFICP